MVVLSLSLFSPFLLLLVMFWDLGALAKVAPLLRGHQAYLLSAAGVQQALYSMLLLSHRTMLTAVGVVVLVG